MKRRDLRSLDLDGLVARAQTGDDRALNELVTTLYPVVHRIVRVRMSGRLRVHLESDDLVQMALIEVVQRIERFEYSEPGRFVNWVALIVQHQIHDAADHYGAQKRGAARTRSLEALRDGQFGEMVRADTADPAEHTAQHDETAFVDQVVGALPEPQREVIVLRDLAEASWPFVVERLGLPSRAAARELHRRARHELARRLSAGGRA